MQAKAPRPITLLTGIDLGVLILSAIINFMWQNMYIIDFGAGTILAMTGAVLLLDYITYRENSRIQFIRWLWLLALFAILQGPSYWALLFIPLQATTLKATTVAKLEALRVMLLVLSYLALYSFGAWSMRDSWPTWRWVQWAMWFQLFFGLFVVSLIPLSGFYIPNQWLDAATGWGLLMLGVPGSILAALTMSVNAQQYAGRLPLPVDKFFYGAAASLMVHAVVIGIRALPVALPVFGGSLPNESLSIHLAHSASMVGLGYFLLRAGQVFSHEQIWVLEDNRQQQALLQERLRIGRDLHDGVIQSLYGIGLSLGAAAQAGEAQGKDMGFLRESVERLDQTIADIRSYIWALEVEGDDVRSLQNRLAAIVHQFQATTSARISFKFRGMGNGTQLPPGLVFHLGLILHESLSNAVRHSGAQHIVVNLEFTRDGLDMVVRDDGKGIGPADIKSAGMGGRGIANMRERSAALGGTVDISSTPNNGTTVYIYIPLGGGQWCSKPSVS